jgi:putative addiction module component (TIGR02574 family)
MTRESPCPDGVPVPEWQKAELERRRQEYLRNPNSAKPWSEVKRSILERTRSSSTGRG